MVPISEIEAIEHNADTLASLRRQMGDGIGVVPFIGAGVSASVGYPDWETFLRNIASDAGVDNAVDDLLRRGDHEGAAETASKGIGALQFEKAIAREFGRHKLPARLMDGLVGLIPQVFGHLVITTNYDYVLEWAYKESGREFDSVTTGARPNTAATAIREHRRVLLKIHGSAEEPVDRILRKSDYDKWYGPRASGPHLDQDLPGFLDHLFSQNQPVLFLGCSLISDRTLDVLAGAVARHPSVEHYAIVPEPDPTDRHPRFNFMSELRINPIWYPRGRYESVEAILASLPNLAPPVRAPVIFLETVRRELFDIVATSTLDWRNYFKGPDGQKTRETVAPTVWAEDMLPELLAVERAIADSPPVREAGSRLIRARGRAWLAAWFAFGSVFRSVKGYSIEVQQDPPYGDTSAGPRIWRTTASPSDLTLVAAGVPDDGDTIDPSGTAVAVALSVTVDIGQSVRDDLPHLPEIVCGFLHLMPSRGVSPQALQSAEDAVAFAVSAKERLRALIRARRANKLYVYCAGPLSAGCFLGHQLNAMGCDIQIMERSGEGETYAPAFLLSTR